ncbi:MAG: hypothetical protein M3N49_13465 [Candidatus Eremiobacteraeota bacterium]|nr:hypothetical protein [Candidatus Eremiobacteraeota bacterium]
MTQLITIAGGVASVYILLALITSHVCEWISAFTNQRGHVLEQAIVVLLGGVRRDPARDAATKELVDHLYDSPLMGNTGTSPSRLPSYIPARTFTISLVASLGDYAAAVAAASGKGAGPMPMPAAFSTPDVLLGDLKARVTGLPDGRLKNALVTVLEGTSTDYDAALAAIDTWFDAQMDRAAGAYKRWSSAVQAVVGLIIVLALNTDTLNLITQLHGLGNAPVLMDAAKSANGQALIDAVQSSNGRSTSQLLTGLSDAGVTVGWSMAPPTAGQWLMKLAGLAITWIAVLMGAPFWFDLLKQVVPVRMSGAKPVTTDDEASTDRQAKHVAPAGS